MRRVALVIAAAIAGTAPFLSGCERDRATEPIPVIAPARDIIARHNARVRRIERLWASVQMRITSPDADGSPVDEVADGVLQYVRPSNVYFSVRKLGETYLQIGADSTRYWWIDLIDDDRRVARVGEHSRATLDRVRSFGVPVHPLDLIELLAITPLSSNAGPGTYDITSKLIEFRMPGRWGERRVLFDPQTLDPARVELIDRGGNVLASSELEAYQEVVVIGDAAAHARIAERVIVTVPREKTTLRFTITDPQNRGARMSADAFNFDALLRAHHVSDVRSLDDGAVRRPPR